MVGTYIPSEGVEEGAILVVFKSIPELMFPYDTPRPRKIHKPEIERVSRVIPHESYCSLQSCIRPVVWIGVRIINSPKTCVGNLIGGLRYCVLDS